MLFIFAVNILTFYTDLWGSSQIITLPNRCWTHL